MSDYQEFKMFAHSKTVSTTRNKAIIYTRVSTKEQAENNTSLETQKKYCEQFAIKNGYEITAYFGGTYESAKSDERKEFQKMIKYAKQNNSVGYIIVYSYDRFSRTGSNAAFISKELKDKGILTQAVTQEVDTTTPSGTFQENLFYLFSQFDNDLRRDKTITAMSELLRKGHWLWTPPRGYENTNKHQKAVDWNIIINEDGKLLKKAFKWKAQRKYSNVEIIRKLKMLGMEITERRLSKIFKTPFYCGILVCKMIPGEIILGKHDPIVSQKDFLKINNPDSNLYPKEHKTTNENLPLKQFIRCSCCDTLLTGFLVKKKGIYYYKCRTKGCKSSKNAKKLHNSFEEILAGYKIDQEYSDIIQDVMVYTYEEMSKDSKEIKKGIEKEVLKLTTTLNKVEERFAIGEIDKQIYQKYSLQYKNEIEELQQKNDTSIRSSSNLKKCISNALKLSSNLNELWANGNHSQKQKIQKIVFPDGIGYDKQLDKVQTFRVNSIFTAISSISTKLKGTKKGEAINYDDFSFRVTSEGFKPSTATAVMWYSIQLNYEANLGVQI